MPTTLQSVNESKWQDQLAALIKHMEENNGHVPYPRRGQPADVERIGQWVQKQRKAYKAGTIAPHRRDRLMEVSERILLPAQTHRSLDETAFLRGVEKARLAAKDKVKTSESADRTITVTEALNIIDSALDGLVGAGPSQNNAA